MRVYTYSQVSVVFRVSKSFSSFSFRCYHEFQLKSTWVSKFLSFLSFHGFLRFYVVFCGFLGHKTEKNSISQLLMPFVLRALRLWRSQQTNSADERNGDARSTHDFPIAFRVADLSTSCPQTYVRISTGQQNRMSMPDVRDAPSEPPHIGITTHGACGYTLSSSW
jgi:hypothetical protein